MPYEETTQKAYGMQSTGKQGRHKDKPESGRANATGRAFREAGPAPSGATPSISSRRAGIG